LRAGHYYNSQRSSPCLKRPPKVEEQEIEILVNLAFTKLEGGSPYTTSALALALFLSSPDVSPRERAYSRGIFAKSAIRYGIDTEQHYVYGRRRVDRAESKCDLRSPATSLGAPTSGYADAEAATGMVVAAAKVSANQVLS